MDADLRLRGSRPRLPRSREKPLACHIQGFAQTEEYRQDPFEVGTAETSEGLCGTSRENRLAPRQQRSGVDAAGHLGIGLPRCRGPRGVNPGRNEVGVLHRRTAGQVAPRGECTRQLCQRPEGSRRHRQCESQRLTHRQRIPAGSGQSDSRRQAAPQEQRLHRRHHQRTAAARLPVPVNQPQTQAVLLPAGRTGHP